MTEAQLQTIERELGVQLPEDYRETSLDFPFQPVGNDWVYWMYDTPDRVIGATRYPLEDGNYDKANWKASYIVIGESASGDLYFLDTALDDSPIYCLSHEDHAMTTEWEHIDEFVADCIFTEQALERKAMQDERRGHRRAFLLALFSLIFLLAVTPMLLFLSKQHGFPVWLMAMLAASVSLLLLRTIARAIQSGIYY